MAQPNLKLPDESKVPDVTNRLEDKRDNVDDIFPGGTSDVYLGHLRTDHGRRRVAVKKLRILPKIPLPKVMERFTREVNAWHELQKGGVHRHIVELLGIVGVAGVGKPGIVLPYYENNDALSYIQKERFSEWEKAEIVLNIAKGLEHMHVKCNVIHGDVKLKNILFDDAGVPKICDFGFSRIIEIRGFTTRTPGVTTIYLAPEILKLFDNHDTEKEPEDDKVTDKFTTKEGDIYAFAILIAEVVTEEQCRLRRSTVDDRLRRNIRPKMNSRLEKYSSLLEDCWKTNPAERLTVEKIIPQLEHIMLQFQSEESNNHLNGMSRR